MLNVRLVLLVAAIVLAAVFTVVEFGWFWDSTSHPFGWLGLALVCGYASRLPLKGKA